jgi:hypothetical protein
VIIKRIEEAMAFVRKVASGPTRAHAAHQALLRIWATGGLAAADEAMWDIALPLFESEDTKLAIPGAVQALAEGKPRPQFRFKGRRLKARGGAKMNVFRRVSQRRSACVEKDVRFLSWKIIGDTAAYDDEIYRQS